MEQRFRRRLAGSPASDGDLRFSISSILLPISARRLGASRGPRCFESLSAAHPAGRTERQAQYDRYLDSQRWLSVNAPEDVWLRTAPIRVDGVELGRIHARRLSAGLVQVTYVPVGGSRSDTQRWVVPADAPVDAWLVSSELERGSGASRDDLVQRVADQSAGAGTAQFGDHLTLLALIENNLQRNP